MHDPATLVDLLHHHARRHPRRTLYTFLGDDEEVRGELTYGELARAVEGFVARFGDLRGERALLLHPPGLELAAAFWGCLAAGITAVPVHLPGSARGRGGLRAIVRDARPRAVLGDAAVVGRAEAVRRDIPELAELAWHATDEIPGGDGTDFDAARLGPAPGDLAFLQYTSGSTGTPRGVRVLHGNLLHNQRMIRDAFGHDDETVVVGWLPLYHDMGLIGNLLQPSFVGGRCVLMAPSTFLRRPASWLRAISRYRATTSGGPNFAYALCADRIGEEERAALDLSTWRVAFNGAEPVRAETLEHFAATFAPQGFRRRAFLPCYGLAEATLLVSAVRHDAEPAVLELDAAALEAHRAEKAEDRPPNAGPTRRLVACGPSWGEQRLEIVDPESAEPLPPGTVGEIWVAGPSVADGYWERPDDDAFGACLAGEPEGDRFLRTGDLGFVDHSGDLVITGRLKDLIILRGRNHYPQDLERTVEQAHPALRPDAAAAFAVQTDDGEALVVVCEIDRHAAGDAPEALAAARRALAETHEITPREIVLLRQASIPKTTSGKIRRRHCRDLYLGDALKVTARDALAAPSSATDREGAKAVEIDLEALRALAPDARREALRDLLRADLAERLGAASPAVDQPLTAQGLDSLRAAELAEHLRRTFGAALSPADLLDGIDLEALAERLAGDLEVDLADAEASPTISSWMDAPPRRPREAPRRPSPEQERLWMLQQLHPESSAYHIPLAWRLRGPLNPSAWRAALGRVGARHETLRSRLVDRGGRLVVEILEDQLAPARVDLDALPEPRREIEADRLADGLARRPFTPDGAGTDPPLLRVALLRLGAAEHHFVFVAHHLIFDLRSADLLVRELTTLYDAAVAGRAVRLPTLDRDAADLAHAERRARQEGRFDAALDAWRRALADPPRVDLPTDRERPREPAHRAWSHSFTLSAERAAALERIGRERGATLFMTLLAAFHATLARWSGESRFLVACPVTGRGAAARDLLGFFAYPLLIVHEWPGEAAATSFETVLASARAAALDAYGRQDVPFARVIEATRGARLVPRLLFGLVDEVVARPETVELQTIELEKGATDFDLAVTLRRARGGDGSLRGRLEAPRALFDAATLELLVDTFLEVLETVAEAPRTLLGELPATALAAHGERLRRLREPWTLAVSATFTADPLSDPLKLWMDELGRPARIVLAPYHQMLQDLLSPSSDLGRNRFGANLLLVRLEDLWRFAAEGETGAPLARAEAWIGEFVDALGSAVERSMQDKAGDGARRGLHWLVALCPPSPGARREHPGLDALEDALAEAVAALPGVDLLRADVLGGPEPPGQIHDPHADELGHIPYTPLYFAALATAFARRLHAANRPPVKILAVDADETLWRGVVGEDGPLGVVVDGPRRAFQQRLLTQREAGRLLAICSKNVEADVREVLASHPDMVLRPEHISAWAVSWRPKSSGLAEIAQTLDLGLDSIVFLDDNPLEIAEVEANAPEVTAIALPADPEQDAAPGTNTLARFLDHLWVLDIDRTTDEDRRRAAWYAEETARAARRRAAPSLADFLAALELEVRIDPAVADDAPRLAQLTERTNQFHCAKRARGETEILGGELAAHAVRVRDRFGDYGLVGALLSRPHGDALRAETFLLSCRALGRGVEHRMLAALGEFAVERGLAAVEIPFERAPRNRPALDFLRAVVGDGEIPGAAGGALFRIAADDAARVVFAPAEEVVASPSAPAERQTDERRTDTAEAPPELLRRGGAVLRRAALELAGAERVLDAARARRAASRRPTGEAVLAPSTPTEKELAALWSDLLGVGEVGANADFFDLGGDSLLGVQLISRVRERFGVEIPLRDLLSDTFTVAKMAEVVEEHQIRDADDEDLDDILAELDGLSDEEIRALLESEETSEV